MSLETLAGTSVGVSQFSLSQSIHDVQRWLAESQPLKFTLAAHVLLFVPGDVVKVDPSTELASLVNPETPHRLTLFVAVSTSRWSKTKSNLSMAFSDDDRSITRPGSKSTFPAGRSEKELTGAGDSFSVLVTKLVIHANALSIGIIAKGGTEKRSVAGGIGGEPKTIGINITNVQYQSKRPPQQIVQVGGVRVGPARGILQEGDSVRFAIRESNPEVAVEADTKLGVDIFINHKLFCSVPIPNSFCLPFQPACTLCNDATLTLEG